MLLILIVELMEDVVDGIFMCRKWLLWFINSEDEVVFKLALNNVSISYEHVDIANRWLWVVTVVSVNSRLRMYILCRNIV